MKEPIIMLWVTGLALIAFATATNVFASKTSSPKASTRSRLLYKATIASGVLAASCIVLAIVLFFIQVWIDTQ